MPLSFLTKSQQFVFVDPSTVPPANVNPEAVAPNHLYDVYLVVENTDAFEAVNVQVAVSHSAFGIGRLAGTDGLTQPAPVNVPPAAYGIPGQATVVFTFISPPGGHGCLYADIAASGAAIGQNVTVTSCPTGVASTLSFVVFGGAQNEQMVLTLTESIQGGAVLPAGSPLSWHPLMIAPAGTGPIGPHASPITLSLTPNVFDSVGLQVTVPNGANVAHVFSIVGTVNGVYEGEVDIVVNPVAGLVPPDPFVNGGYQSADILLFDANNNAVPLGGQPNAQWDTLLVPNTPYKISAVVHNDSTTPAVNTVVRFWSIPGGVATAGTLLSVVTVTVPANSSVQVNSPVPFTSAPAGQHRCAAVSVYNSQSLHATVDPSTAAQIPDPNADVAHSNSAWRNTDSMFIIIGRPWTFTVQGTLLANEKVPLKVTANAVLAAATLEKTPAALAVNQTLLASGAKPTLPVFLNPTVRATLPPANLQIQVGAAKPVANQLAEFTLSGVTPADAKVGDRYLVTVGAQYGNRTVDFLHTLYVKAG